MTSGHRTVEQSGDRVSGIKITGEKRLVLVSGRAHPQLAIDIAAELGSELVPTDARTFANGEIYARYDESVRGCDVFVIQSHTPPINEWLMEQLIMVDAAQARLAPSASPSSRRSTPTPAKTRRAAAASRSRPASSPTCSRPPAPTAS